MRQTTLVLVFNSNNQVLLCMKKRWFWVGKYNWAGWKVEWEETIIEAAKRELQEETWIDVGLDILNRRWVFHFYFDNKSDWNQDVTLFTIDGYNWEITETEEMKPEWFDIDKIPFDKMWPDDSYWLPRILTWEREVEYNFTFDENWQIMEFKQII